MHFLWVSRVCSEAIKNTSEPNSCYGCSKSMVWFRPGALNHRFSSCVGFTLLLCFWGTVKAWMTYTLYCPWTQRTRPAVDRHGTPSVYTQCYFVNKHTNISHPSSNNRKYHIPEYDTVRPWTFVFGCWPHFQNRYTNSSTCDMSMTGHAVLCCMNNGHFHCSSWSHFPPVSLGALLRSLAC